jgi:hypothetical protein
MMLIVLVIHDDLVCWHEIIIWILWVFLWDMCDCTYNFNDDVLRCLMRTWEGLLGWDILIFMSRRVRVSSHVIYVHSCIHNVPHDLKLNMLRCPSRLKTEYDADGYNTILKWVEGTTCI